MRFFFIAFFLTLLSFLQATPLINKPVLYYLSSPGCPACRMMAPVIDEIEKEYQDKLKVVRMMEMSKNKMEIIRKFSGQVNLQYVPTMVFAGKDDLLLGYTRGYVPKEEFKTLIEEAIVKFQKSDHLKIKNLLMLCSSANSSCDKLTSTVADWLKSSKKTTVQTEVIDIQNLEDEKTFENYKQRMGKIKWLHGLEYIPAIIGLTEQQETVDYIQSGVSRSELEKNFSRFF